MASITIDFSFEDGTVLTHGFEDVDSCLQNEIDEVTESHEEENDTTLEDWNVVAFEVDEDDQQGPKDVGTLAEWGEYCEQVEQHGNAYCIRYADIGEHDFEDEDNGEWDSAEDFVQNLIEDCECLTLPHYVYIDWERTAQDVMMDYTAYDTGGGVHIFRD